MTFEELASQQTHEHSRSHLTFKFSLTILGMEESISRNFGGFGTTHLDQPPQQNQTTL